MLDARHFRAQARDALHGRWGTAVLAGLIAMIFCSGFGSAMNSGASGQDMGLQQLEAMTRMIWMLSSIGAVLSIVSFIIGGAVEMGYAHFNLRMIDGEPVRVGMVFAHIHRIGAGIGLLLLRYLYILVWVLIPVAVVIVYAVGLAFSMPIDALEAMENDPEAMAMVTMQLMPLIMLSCIPAIIVSYRYLLAPYIMAEHPEIRPRDALRLSKDMMRGVKLRAFWLQLSFTGWVLLSLFTFGIGMLWVQPYMAAAQAAFYREVCKFRKIQKPEPEQPRLNQGPEF